MDKLDISNKDTNISFKYTLNLKKPTVLKERIANKLAIIVEKPGAKHDWAMKPSFSSAKHTTSSPRRQSQDGILSKYAWRFVFKGPPQHIKEISSRRLQEVRLNFLVVLSNLKI